MKKILFFFCFLNEDLVPGNIFLYKEKKKELRVRRDDYEER